MLEEPLICQVEREQVIHIDSVQKLGCSQFRKDYLPEEQRRSVHSLHMATLAPALACMLT